MSGSEATRGLSHAMQMADATGVTSQIRSASKATGVSFDYLMAQAGKESAFVSDAKSSVSSAAGLFQFTKSTWLQQIKLHGAKHGLGPLAEQIERNDQGDYVVKDGEMRQKILALRRDPSLSSLIAGEYARDNRHWLEKSLGRKVGSTELYLAHFLGPAGAVKFLKARTADPTQSAAAVVPQAAEKNQRMFYEADHSAQSVAALYNRVRQVMENPSHPPHRKSPPADLAVAALRYGDLPWADNAAHGSQSTDKLVSSLHMSIQAYTDSAKSAAKITGSMPPPTSSGAPAAIMAIPSPVAPQEPGDIAPGPLDELFKDLSG